MLIKYFAYLIIILNSKRHSISILIAIIINHLKMIPDKNTLTRFLKARMNFFVYGPRASGKTTLLKEVFNDAGI